VIADNATAAAAAVSRASELGFNALLATTYLEGEAREAGRFVAAMAKESVARGLPVAVPACIVFGGETTVTLRHLGGKGGRNQELALASAVALAGWRTAAVAAMGTDGIDGSSAAAGALVDGATVGRALDAGLDPLASLERHDSGAFFEALGDAVVTGPTGTNVNDLCLALALPPGEVPG
jgi:hydroxypyruvate reductase